MGMGAESDEGGMEVLDRCGEWGMEVGPVVEDGFAYMHK